MSQSANCGLAAAAAGAALEAIEEFEVAAAALEALAFELWVALAAAEDGLPPPPPQAASAASSVRLAVQAASRRLLWLNGSYLMQRRARILSRARRLTCVTGCKEAGH